MLCWSTTPPPGDDDEWFGSLPRKKKQKKKSSYAGMEMSKVRDVGDVDPLPISPPFEAGDHVVLPCLAAGFIPYEHHAIVLSIGIDSNNKWTMCVSNFTIAGDDGGGSGRSTSINSGGVVPSRCYGDGTNENDDENSSTTKDRHNSGMRLLCVDVQGWRRIHYAENAPVDCLVRRRVEFLLNNPHIIPSPSWAECNGECVAVWCKTGRWTTLQFESLVDKTNLASRVAIAGLWLLWAIDVTGTACLLTTGIVTETVTGIWGNRARRGWEKRTKKLNDEFDITSVNATAVINDSADCEQGAMKDTTSDTKPFASPFNKFFRRQRVDIAKRLCVSSLSIAWTFHWPSVGIIVTAGVVAEVVVIEIIMRVRERSTMKWWKRRNIETPTFDAVAIINGIERVQNHHPREMMDAIATTSDGASIASRVSSADLPVSSWTSASPYMEANKVDMAASTDSALITSRISNAGMLVASCASAFPGASFLLAVTMAAEIVTEDRADRAKRGWEKHRKQLKNDTGEKVQIVERCKTAGSDSTVTQ